VTIHDLIKQMSVGSATTTLPMPIYWLKYLVVNYWIIKQAVYLSKAIIVPSKFVKQQIVDNFETRNLKLANKIFVTYEAPDSTYFMKSLKPTFVKATVDRHESNKASELLKSYQLKANSYFIYTGNAYPHKNLEKLVEAVKQVVRSQKSEVRSNIKLAIVCARGVFRERVEKFVKEQGMEDMVKFLGFVEDEVLRELYRQSLTFITPSKLEGFGLSGLEAMAAGTVVLSSNASCLPETYGDAAIYFDPDSGEEMVEKIESVLRMRSEERKRLIKLGIKRARGFSWERMAKETLKVYDFAY
jgi:glycosyltransferase involved in cell wall biosynthesis